MSINMVSLTTQGEVRLQLESCWAQFNLLMIMLGADTAYLISTRPSTITIIQLKPKGINACQSPIKKLGRVIRFLILRTKKGTKPE